MSTASRRSRRSALELAERSITTRNTRHVVRLALRMFDQTRTVHHLHQSRAGVVGVRGFAWRHRLANQLRAPPPAFLLFDPEWRFAGLRIRTRNRSRLGTGHRCRRGTPKQSRQKYCTVPVTAAQDGPRAHRPSCAWPRSLNHSHTQTPRLSRNRSTMHCCQRTGDAELEVWATNRHLNPSRHCSEDRAP